MQRTYTVTDTLTGRLTGIQLQMDGRAWNSGYQVTVDGWQSSQWVKSIREVTRIFNEHGIQVSHSKVYQIQAQRDDIEAGRPNARVIRPLWRIWVNGWEVVLDVRLQ